MSNKRKPDFRVQPMNLRVKLADANAGKYYEQGTFARTTTYQAWHKGYDAAVRHIRKTLKGASR